MTQSSQLSRRESVFVLSMLIVLGLIASALVPPEVSSKPGRDRDGASSRDSTQAPVAVRDAMTQSRRGGVDIEVVGGSTAPQGKYNFVTFVQIDVGGGFAVQCGGTLIDPLFVLTAAHCVEDEAGDLFAPSRYLLGIGKADLNALESENLFGVTDVERHPDWDRDAFANDVAVLELDEAVPSSIAQPLPIVGSGDTQFNEPGQAAAVAGWGLTSGGGNGSATLREATLSVVSDAACEDAFGDLDGSVVICAGKAGKSSCNGDSGGPLMAPEVAAARAKNGSKAEGQKQEAKAERKKHHKKHHRKRHKKKRRGGGKDILSGPFVQIGIVSFGGLGCPKGAPSGYTQLSAPAIHDFVGGVVGN